jgi:hypothetical protein
MGKKPGKSQLLGKKGNGKGNIGAGTLVANTLMGEGRGKRKPIHFRSTRIPGQAEVTESSEEKREEKRQAAIRENESSLEAGEHENQCSSSSSSRLESFDEISVAFRDRLGEIMDGCGLGMGVVIKRQYDQKTLCRVISGW